LFLKEATARYEKNLDSVADLLRSKGSLHATAVQFRLGAVADPMPGHERFLGMLAIPYILYDDTVVSLRFRCPIADPDHSCKEAGHPKYLSEADDESRLYNTGALFRAQDVIHVSEGEGDCRTLEQAGWPAVGFPGVQSVKRHHLRLLNGFTRIYVWGDGDDAGAEFSRRIRKSHRSATIARVPTSMDVTTLFVKEGFEGLKRAIRMEN
jgi:hypothetical protein